MTGQKTVPSYGNAKNINNRLQNKRHHHYYKDKDSIRTECNINIKAIDLNGHIINIHLPPPPTELNWQLLSKQLIKNFHMQSEREREYDRGSNAQSRYKIQLYIKGKKSIIKRDWE